MVEYSKEVLARRWDEVAVLPAGSAIEPMLADDPVIRHLTTVNADELAIAVLQLGATPEASVRRHDKALAG